MFLEIFDHNHNFICVASLLVRQNLKLILRVPLHKHIVLVQYLDSLVDLKNFPRLHVLKVDLPFLCFLRQAIDLTLQVRHLMLHELFHSRHHFFDSSHLLRQGVIRQSSMLDRLFL